METMPQSPQESQKCHTHNIRAYLRGSKIVTQSEGGPAATATQATAAMEALATSPWESRPLQPLSDCWPLCPPPGFLGIAQMLRMEEPMESSPPSVVTGIPTQQTTDVMGTAVMAARLLRNQATGEMLVDVQVCSEGIVGLGLKPEDKETVNVCPLTIQELPDFNGWTCQSTTWHSSKKHCIVFIWQIQHDISLLYYWSFVEKTCEAKHGMQSVFKFQMSFLHLGQMFPPVEASSDQEQYYIRLAWHLQPDVPSSDVPPNRGIQWPWAVLHQVSLTFAVRHT